MQQGWTRLAPMETLSTSRHSQGLEASSPCRLGVGLRAARAAVGVPEKQPRCESGSCGAGSMPWSVFEECRTFEGAAGGASRAHFADADRDRDRAGVTSTNPRNAAAAAIRGRDSARRDETVTSPRPTRHAVHLDVGCTHCSLPHRQQRLVRTSSPGDRRPRYCSRAIVGDWRERRAAGTRVVPILTGMLRRFKVHASG